MDRYERVVELLEQAYATNDQIMALQCVDPTACAKCALWETLYQQGDELVDFIIENFPVNVGSPEQQRADVREYYDNNPIVPITAEYLRSLSPNAVACAVLRHSISGKRCKWDSQKMKSFARFAQAFGHVIMA
jgi:hypothetical protein